MVQDRWQAVVNAVMNLQVLAPQLVIYVTFMQCQAVNGSFCIIS
jgi:hypothetical protein